MTGDEKTIPQAVPEEDFQSTPEQSIESMPEQQTPAPEAEKGENPVYETVPYEIQPETVPEEETAESISQKVKPEGDGPAEGTPPTEIHEESSNKMKFVFIGLAILLFIVIFILIAKFLMGGTKKEEQEPVTLKYWGLWEEESTYQPLLTKFKQQYPNITVKYTKMDPRKYRQKLVARDEQSENRPDIFRFHNTWIPQIKQVVAPVPKDILSNSQYEELFYSVIQEDLSIDDNYYGIPLEIDGLVLIYNDKLFKAAGIEAPPASWDEVIDYAVRLSVKDVNGNIFTSGIALGTSSNVEHFSDILGWMILQNGGEITDLSSSEAVGALEQYRAFAEPPFNLWDANLSNSIAAFIQEEVAMVIAPSWQILTIKEANPDIELKVTVLPQVPGGTQISLASYWVEGVSRYSAYQTEAWKFLRFLLEKENMTALYEEAAKVRLFGEPYSRVDLGSLLLQDEYIGPVISQAQYMRSISTISRTYDDGLNDEIIQYLSDAVNSTAEGVSYQEAFRTASRGVSQVIGRYSTD